MLVLGVESAADQCGCALVGADGLVAEARLAVPRRHAEALAPQMRFVCEQAGVALGEVDVVAVDHGPGLYTGLRAGLATAKATAAALGVPVVRVGSLEALAAGAGPQPGDVVLSVLDARRGEVFWAWYRCVAPDGIPHDAEGNADRLLVAQAVGVHPDGIPYDAEGEATGAGAGSGRRGAVGGLVPLSDPQVGPPSAPAAELAASAPGGARELASIAGGGDDVHDRREGAPGGARELASIVEAPAGGAPERVLVVGDGAIRYRDVFDVGSRAAIAGRELRFPTPAVVALLGRERALAGQTVAPETVDALYLRRPDARPPGPPATLRANTIGLV